jgi:NAD(P)-dependent dehydrogenase (short-subunit alcohol dehydrogenase family)
MTRTSPHLRDNKEAAEAERVRAALGRLGSSEDVSGIVVFLASHDGRWVTDQVIDASGGTALSSITEVASLSRQR